MTAIKFGTDGWRAIMAEEFTFDNVRLVSEAIARYLDEEGFRGQGIVVGYDNRFLSEHFARAVSEVLTGHDFRVFLPERAIPTPVTAFAIKEYGAGGAVMLTASHNPPEYNGIKFIPQYAGPALPHITDKIEGHLKRGITLEQVKRMDFKQARQQGRIETIDPMESYLQHLEKVVDGAALGRRKLRIAVDPMWGAGYGYLEKFLTRVGCQVEAIHSYRDPLFGGSMPEPSAAVLGELRDKVVAGGFDLGLALDGDADRFGIIDPSGEYITPNQVLAIIFYHLQKTRGWQGKVARTVATTHLLDRMAERKGLGVEETPVGFKYIGQCLMERECFLGGEESGGLSVRGHLPEKDGILAAALMAEVVALEGKSPREILDQLAQEYGPVHNRRLDVHCAPAEKAVILEAMKNLEPAEVAGVKVRGRVTIDGTKLVLEDGSWTLVRASGTEPLFRIYAEANTLEQVDRIQQDVRQYLGL